jgi:cytoskeleton protein RodZ
MSESADTAPAADAAPVEPGPGARLRAAREQCGLALGAVAETLHVAPRIVAAMEANDFGAFDAPVYAKGFLRKYSALLGVPTDEVLAAYDALSGGPSHPTLIPAMNVAPAKAAAVPLPPAVLLVVVAVRVLAGGSYWWWCGHSRGPAPGATAESRAERDAPVAGTLVPAQQPTVAEDTAPATAAAAPAEAGPRPAETAPSPLPAVAPVLPAAPAPAPTARHRATGATGAHEEALVIHGVRECWVEVYAPGGARLVYDLVHPGETLTAAGPGPWKVFLGYADGARLTVGERTVGVPQGRRAAATARFVVGRDGAAQ